jgi:hypothetical protein
MEMKRRYGWLGSVLLISALLCAYAIRWPIIANNIRYFRNERDAIAFAKITEVAKTGTLTTTDRMEVALNTYIRLPSFLASTRLAQMSNQIADLSEIKTNDPYGPEGYAVAVTHPSLLLGSRVFSMLLSLAVVSIVFVLILQLGGGVGCAFVGALICALSPEALKISHLLTPEILTLLSCIGCMSLSLSALKSRSLIAISSSSILAGMATALTHATAPILLVPLFVVLKTSRTFLDTSFVLVFSLFGFAGTTPLIIPDFHQFFLTTRAELSSGWINPFKTSTTDIALERATIILGWFLLEGVGIASGGLAVASLVYFVRRFNSRIACFLIFPTAYFVGLIINEKVTTGQFVILIPFVSVMAALGLQRLLQATSHPIVKKVAIPAFAAVIALQLLAVSIMYVRAQSQPDSRDIASNWIAKMTGVDEQVAIAGTLLMGDALRTSRADVFDPVADSAAQMLQRGFSYVVTGPEALLSDPHHLLSLVNTIDGERVPRKVPSSPEIKIYRIREERLPSAAQSAPASLLLTRSDEVGRPSCETDHDPFCWIEARATTLRLDGAPPGGGHARLSVNSPWRGQRIAISTELGTQIFQGTLESAGNWEEISFTLPPRCTAVVLTLSHVRKMPQTGPHLPSTRVGLAIRTIHFDLGTAEQGKSPTILVDYPEEIQAAVQSAFESSHTVQSDGGRQAQATARLQQDIEAIIAQAPSAPLVSANTDRLPRKSQIRRTFVDSILAAPDDPAIATDNQQQ